MIKYIYTLIFTISLFISALQYDRKKMKLGKVRPGIWSLDYKTALEYAKLEKNKKKLVFIKFPGGKLCGSCKKTDKRVFLTRKWQKFAKKNLILIYFSGSNLKLRKKIGAEQVRLQQSLAWKYKLKRSPAYVIVDHNGDLMGKMSYIASPKNFEDQCKRFVKAYDLKKFIKSVQGKYKEKYLVLNKELENLKEDLTTFRESNFIPYERRRKLRKNSPYTRKTLSGMKKINKKIKKLEKKIFDYLESVYKKKA